MSNRGDNTPRAGLVNMVPGTVTIRVGSSIAEAERSLIEATLAHCGGNKTRAAAVLGISLKTLYNRLNGYRVD